MMRNFFVVICLFISVNAIAQQRDTIYISGKKLVILDATNESGKAYIEVDDKIFTGKLSSIKADDIVGLTIMKPVDAKKLYGAKGGNGAYYIKTKAGQMAAMQPPIEELLGNNTGDNHSIAELETMVKDSAMYLIDGELSAENKIKKLNPEDIISIDILKKGKIADPSFSQIKNDVVAVITKSGATKSYQKKFGRFSREYAEYLQANHFDDSNIVYMNATNGEVYKQSTKEGITLLYKLLADDIKKAEFSKGHQVASGTYPPLLAFTTK